MSARELLTKEELEKRRQALHRGVRKEASEQGVLPDNAILDVDEVFDMALASLEPVAMPENAVRYMFFDGTINHKCVDERDYDALRAWAARGELSEARIREITELTAWIDERIENSHHIADMKYGADREGWLVDAAYYERIRQALGESKP